MPIPLCRHLTLGVFSPDDRDPEVPWAVFAGKVEMTPDEYREFMDVVAEPIRGVVGRN